MNVIIKMLGLLFAGMLAGPMTGQAAAIEFSLNNSTDLRGTFSFTGIGYASVSPGTSPGTFMLLPWDFLYTTSLMITRYPDASGSSGNGSFGADLLGYQDSPSVVVAYSSSGLSIFGPYSGVYKNSDNYYPDGTPVYWRFYDWQDTGGSTGTFSGAFCFSTSDTACNASTTPVPVPAAAWLLLSGLGGLGFLRKRRAA